jgi:N-acetyl-gamma-glutamyl-phosphate reductase
MRGFFILYGRNSQLINAAVLGATGYTGTELVRLISNHPGAELVLVSSESQAGKKISEVHPQMLKMVDLTLEQMQPDKIPASVDVVFCALPHGKSAAAVSLLHKKGMRVIDLSADFRLKEPELYKEWYALDHPAPSLLPEAVYGLPELYRDQIKNTRLVANPGCYPTSILLALAPLLKADLAETGKIIIDAKSGVSGAGRAPRQPFHFPECTENFKAYRVASHQHTPEIEQELGKLAGEKLRVTFTPHLVPMVRGILSTIYIELKNHKSEKELYGLYDSFYTGSTFVRVLEPPMLPETRYVRGSNFCDIALRFDPRTGQVVIISVIDNLVRGASGQAVQNMNLMFGLPEETGLGQMPY